MLCFYVVHASAPLSLEAETKVCAMRTRSPPLNDCYVIGSVFLVICQFPINYRSGFTLKKIDFLVINQVLLVELNSAVSTHAKICELA